ncbi:AMP-binding protein, partial [Melaminivora alkalimesophila]
MSTPLHHAVWPERLPHAITVPATSVWENLEVSARRYPAKTALVFMGRDTSYRELCDATERLAAWLYGIGVRKGDRVLLLAQNTPQLVTAHYAILRANAVVVPVNPMNLPEELQHYIRDSGARVAITTADLAGQLAQASNELPEAERLQHLLVSQFTDAFDPEAMGPVELPAAWRPWLLGD